MAAASSRCSTAERSKSLMVERRIVNPNLPASAARYGSHGSAGTLTKAECEDLIEFTRELLERLTTEPARVVAAKERCELRRSGGSSPSA